MRRDCPNTALNYYQILLKRGVVNWGARDCPNTAQTLSWPHFARKWADWQGCSLKSNISPIIYCLHYPEKEKGGWVKSLFWSALPQIVKTQGIVLLFRYDYGLRELLYATYPSCRLSSLSNPLVVSPLSAANYPNLDEFYRKHSIHHTETLAKLFG